MANAGEIAAVIRLLPERTEIRQASHDTGILSLDFEFAGMLSWGRAIVLLDDTMIALPPAPSPSLSISVGTAGPDMVLNAPELVVEANGQRVSFPLWLVKMNPTARRLLRKEIAFRWRDPVSLPSMVTIAESTEAPLGLVREQKFLRGYNVGKGHELRARIVGFLNHHANSDFFFPSEKVVADLTMQAIRELAAPMQEIKITTLRAVAWPHEVDFFESESGACYLKLQVAKLLRSPTNCPIRLGVNPFALKIGGNLQGRFLEEMEVQRRCGIDIRMIEPESLSDILGDSEAGITILGEAIGIYLFNIYSVRSSGPVSMHFRPDDVRFARQKHEELTGQAVSWESYKSIFRIVFSSEAEGRIARRCASVLRSAKKFASVLE